MHIYYAKNTHTNIYIYIHIKIRKKVDNTFRYIGSTYTVYMCCTVYMFKYIYIFTCITSRLALACNSSIDAIDPCMKLILNQHMYRMGSVLHANA